MTDNWYDLKDALDRMAKLPPRTDFHITEDLADKVKNELDRLKARGFPAPKLLTEEDGDLSLVWRSADFSIYYVISVGEEPYFDVLTTTIPAPQDILDWIKTLPKEPNEKLREAWAMYQAAVKQPAVTLARLVDDLPRFVPPQAAVAGVPFREAVWLDDLRAVLAEIEGGK
jgi:hypothetical protein